MSDFSHLDADGHVHMVDVGSKDPTHRVAVAEAIVVLQPATREALFSGGLPKGDALATVRVAAIMAAKRTSELIPLCHPLPLDAVAVSIEPTDGGARIEVRAETTSRTGVEMEALTGAAVGALTLYDMVKSMERGAEIGPVRLVAKSGGRSGEWTR